MGIIMVYKLFEKARGHDETCITDDCIKTKQKISQPNIEVKILILFMNSCIRIFYEYGGGVYTRT